MSELEVIARIAVALAIGLLIGLERGWQKRDSEEGVRIAGMRTFALVSILGALWGLLSQDTNSLLLGIAFLAFAIVVIGAHIASARAYGDYGITTAIAVLLTFALGAAAMRGYLALSAALAVVTASLLGVKPFLHGLIQRIERHELYAILQFLLISVVLLPVLPNRGFGPWMAINPYEIWWMVVLIAAISFVGYFSVKLGGAKLGLGLTALLGGLTSSTAVTLSYSQMARERPDLIQFFAAGILFASGTMFLRTLLIASFIKTELFFHLIIPLAAMALMCYLSAYWMYRHSPREESLVGEAIIRNPFELRTVLKYGLLLTVVVFMSRLLRAWFGDLGVYLLAATSGIADVDPVTLTLARMTTVDLPMSVAVSGIFVATVVNTIVKGIMATAIARGRMFKLLGVTFIVTLVIGTILVLSV